MKAEYEGIIPLVSSRKGWQQSYINFSFNPNPVVPDYLKPILEEAERITPERRPNDTNGDKVAVKRINSSYNSGYLYIDTDLTNYFTLWGLPQTSPELHQQALKDLATTYSTEIPMGISTHNILLTMDQYNAAKNVAMTVRSASVGFSAGRLSVSFEEQMDPDKDISPFNTAHRGYREELGIYVTNILLLAIGAEKGSAYTSWCHLGRIHAEDDEVIERYLGAKDISETSALLIAPVEEIDQFAEAEIKPEIWRPHLKVGSIANDAILKPHPTVPWRIDALKDFLNISSS